MGKKSFKITVNGETFNVEVEELIKEQNTEVFEEKIVEKASDTDPLNNVNTMPETKPENNSGKQDPATAKKSGGTIISAPMPGAIIDIKVKEGDSVKQDDVLIILEAMKMENEITSPAAGKVVRIMVAKGASVNSKEELLVIE